jgi:hypothetical protein
MLVFVILMYIVMVIVSIVMFIANIVMLAFHYILKPVKDLVVEIRYGGYASAR